MGRLLSALLAWPGVLRRRSASGGDPQSGMAMVLSMSVAFVVFTLGAVWIGLGTHQITATGREKLREQARNVAEAGLNVAMSRLTADATFSGVGLTAMAGGEFEVTVLPVSLDPDDTRRYIVSKGYAPTKANPNRQARRLEQQIELTYNDGFRYALFSAPGGITGANYMTVNGDVYASGDLTLANNSTVTGSVTSLGSVTTSNNTTIAGDVHAADNVTLDNASTTVLGNVYAGGNVSMTGHVKGNVQAGGTISGGTVDGSRSQNSPPAPPAGQTLPTFDWAPYVDGTESTWLSPAQFQTYWSANRLAFSGAHRITCTLTCATIDFGSQWRLTGDTTIYADGPISLSKDIANSAGHAVTLTIVSDATDTPSTPAISMSNNVTLPDNINVVFFAPNGTVKFSQLKHFTGTVYAKEIALSQQFTLTFRPVARPGFDFGLTTSSHYGITAGSFKEVPFS
ncbi:MAG TPA: polymer-forming cytoskeletal protein [Acidimicrobiia bacterium]